MTWVPIEQSWSDSSAIQLPLQGVGRKAVRLVLAGRLHPRHEDEKVLVQLGGVVTGYLSYTSSDGTLHGASDKFLKGFSAGRSTLTGTEVSTVTTGFSLGRAGVARAGDYIAEYTIGAFPRAADTDASAMQRRLGYGHALFSVDALTLIRTTAYGHSPTESEGALLLSALTHLTLTCDHGGRFAGELKLYRDDTLESPVTSSGT